MRKSAIVAGVDDAFNFTRYLVNQWERMTANCFAIHWPAIKKANDLEVRAGLLTCSA